MGLWAPILCMLLLCGSYAPGYTLLSELHALNSYVRDICALLRYYATSSGNYLPTFRDNVSVPSCKGQDLDSWRMGRLKNGPIRCPETSVKVYHSTLRNTSEERRSRKKKPFIYADECCGSRNVVTRPATMEDSAPVVSKKSKAAWLHTVHTLWWVHLRWRCCWQIRSNKWRATSECRHSRLQRLCDRTNTTV